MEQLRKYFVSMTILYVYNGEDGGLLKSFFASLCPKFKSVSAQECIAVKEPLRSHVAIIETSGLSKSKLVAIFKKIVAIESIAVCEDCGDRTVLETLFSFKTLQIITPKPDEKELREKLKQLIISVLSKQKEMAKNKAYAKLIESVDLLFCIKRGDKILFANENLLSKCGLADTASLNATTPQNGTLLEAIKNIVDGERDSFFVKTNSGDNYLVTTRNVQGEQLISCVKIASEPLVESGSLDYIEFIELLKNTLVNKEVYDEPTFAVAIKLENSQKIMEDFGCEFFYLFLKKFSSFCGLFFEKDPFIFWHFDYIVILPDGYEENDIKAKAEAIFTQSVQFKCEKDVTPLVGVSVLFLTRLNINDSIALLEQNYEGRIAPTFSQNVCITLSSASVAVADGQIAMYQLRNIAEKKYKIKLLNTYKGLIVVSGASIIKMVDGEIYVKTEKIQKYLMHVEKRVVIQSEYIPREIFAEVRYVDVTKPYAILKNPIFLEFSANDRKSVRVQCDSRIPIMVSSLKFAFTGEIFDISVSEVVINYKNRINGDISGADVKLTFSLPDKNSESGVVKVVVGGNITVVRRIGDVSRVIVALKMDSQSQKSILEYIYIRQKELITEVKKLGGMIFK